MRKERLFNEISIYHKFSKIIFGIERASQEICASCNKTPAQNVQSPKINKRC